MMNQNNTMENYRMVAKTLGGLEATLAEELLALGAREVEEHVRAVSFTGDKGFLYKANYCCRTAIRILKPYQSIFIRNENDLYRQVKEMQWEDLISPADTIVIDTSLNTSLFSHSQFISQKVKDAIADRFREKTGKRPSVDKLNPTLRINVHVSHDACVVSLDSSGDSLHKRGYRQETGLAPINEVLAAGLVLLSGWDKKSMLIDPMCGSGTIITEAALIAANIPPGFYREKFGFESWKDFDKDLFQKITGSVTERIRNEPFRMIGVDVSHHIIRKAKKNVYAANVNDMIELVCSPFESFDPPPGKGTLIVNPPYGERMDKDDLAALYKSIGDTFKKKYAGYDCWIISSNPEAFKSVGLRPSRKIPVFNGPLECRFMKYSMYAGAKKDMYKVNE